MSSAIPSFRRSPSSSNSSSSTFRRSSLLAVAEEVDEKSISSCENEIAFNEYPRTIPAYRQSKEETFSNDDIQMEESLTLGKCYNDLFSSPYMSSSFQGNFAHAAFESPFKERSYLKNATSAVTPRTAVESPVPSLTLSELSRVSSPYSSLFDTPSHVLKRDRATEMDQSTSLNPTNSKPFNSNYFFTPIRDDDEFSSFFSARSNSVSTIGSELMKDRSTPLPQCRPSYQSVSESLCEPCLPFENDSAPFGNHVLSMFNHSRTVSPQSCVESTTDQDMHRTDSVLSFMSAEDHPMTHHDLDASHGIKDSKGSVYDDTETKKQKLYCSPVKSKSQILDITILQEYGASKDPERFGVRSLDYTRTPTKEGARISFEYESVETPVRANGRYTLDYESSSRSSPLPQNLRGDPNRQAKVKTELCRNFSLGLDCPFGSRCNYAHGEDELKYSTLFELEKAGLVQDITSYRAHPCFSFVATGACPYGLRCGNIHDPRIVGKHTSWLPHSEVPVSSLETDLNVDKTHHELLASLSQENPLVPRLLWDNRPSLKNASFAVKNDDMSTEWKDVYALVCNLANLKEDFETKSSSVYKMKLNELHRLSIALYMNGDCSHARGYIYKPRHLIYNELCMVLRTKYFRLLHPHNFTELNCVSDRPPLSHLVQEISVTEYERSRSLWNDNENVVVVHELAFGCAGEQVSRVSLWFDIDNVTDMSIADVKKFKRQKQRLKGEDRVAPYPGPGSNPSDFERSNRTSNYLRGTYSFENHPHKPFFYARPINNDEVARALVTDMLYHRLSVLLHREFKCFSGSDTEVRELLSKRDQNLRDDYFSVKDKIKRWIYPVSKGLERLTEKTAVPKCNSFYEPSASTNGMDIKKVWLSFTKSFSTDTVANGGSSKTFCALREGKSVHSNSQNLPHIKSFDDSVIFSEEWMMIQEHYQVSSKIQNLDNCMPLSPSVLEKRAEKKD